MKLKKLLLKVLDDATDRNAWVHVAYVEEDLYDKFFDEMDCTTGEFTQYMAKWAKQDFNLNTTMSHTNDILILKELIWKRYKEAYPQIFIESTTDRQGWVRTWLTKKMQEELKIYGKSTNF